MPTTASRSETVAIVFRYLRFIMYTFFLLSWVGPSREAGRGWQQKARSCYKSSPSHYGNWEATIPIGYRIRERTHSLHPAEFSDRVIESQDVFRGGVWLDVVRRGHNVSSALRQNPDVLRNLLSDLGGRAKGESPLVVDGAMKDNRRPEVSSECLAVHSTATPLHRIQNVDSHVDQLWEHRPDRSIIVVEGLSPEGMN